MLLAYDELLSDVVEKGIITGLTDLSQVNGSSIDICLGAELLIEQPPKTICPKCGHVDSGVSKLRQIDRSYWKEWYFCVSCNHGAPLSSFVAPIDFSKKQPLNMESVDCTDGFALWPGEVCLAHSVEKFNLPYNITAEYRLKSSQARVFLEHLHAGWCDPGWHGSVLTLEFKNETRYHPLWLKAGMKCGQICFYRHKDVPEDRSYAVRGQYNHDSTATPSKGLR